MRNINFGVTIFLHLLLSCLLSCDYLAHLGAWSCNILCIVCPDGWPITPAVTYVVIPSGCMLLIYILPLTPHNNNIQYLSTTHFYMILQEDYPIIYLHLMSIVWNSSELIRLSVLGSSVVLYQIVRSEWSPLLIWWMYGDQPGGMQLSASLGIIRQTPGGARFKGEREEEAAVDGARVYARGPCSHLCICWRCDGIPPLAAGNRLQLHKLPPAAARPQ